MSEIKVSCEVCGKTFEKGHSIANHKKWHNPEYRHRCNDHKFGRKHSSSTRKKMRLAKIGRTRGKDIVNKMKKITEKLWTDPEYRRKITESSKSLWKQDDYIKKVMRGRRLRPTKLEKTFLSLVEENNLPLFYVGNGKVIINGRCPDFADGENHVVETLGVFWHYERPKFFDPSHTRKKEVKEIERHYEKNGYDCLCIWEDEMSNLENVTNKVREFLSSSPDTSNQANSTGQTPLTT